MSVPSRIPAAGLAAVLVLAGAGRAAAQPYHDAEYGFNLELPDGWRPMTRAEMKWFNDEQDAAGGQKNLAGFRPATGDLGRGPFAIVKLDAEFAGIPFDEFEKLFTRGYEEATADRPDRRTTLGAPEYDRPRRRFLCRGWVGTGRGRIAVRSGGYLGPNGLILVHSYSPEADLRRYEPVLSEFLDSFHFDGEDPSAKAEPPAAGSAARGWLNKVPGGEYGRMALVGGVTVAIVLVVGAVMLREKRDPRRPTW